jgi:hypothetical protein
LPPAGLCWPLLGVPPWVLDYVLVHELTHLLEPGHDARFWAWVHRYPRSERAMGYLEGLSAAAGLGLVGIDGDEPDSADPTSATG